MQEINNFLTHDECQQLINMIDANHTRSSVVIGGTDRTDITDHRTSSTSNLDMSNTILINLKKKISETLGLELNKGEALQGQLYEPGQYFKPHNDFFSGPAYDMHCKASGNRTHTLMIYLNEGYKGGGTHFPTLQKTVEPKTGKALWWHNLKDGKVQDQYLHEGVTVEEGKKYVVTSWWRENSWDGAGDEKLYNESKNQIQEEASPKKSYVVKASELIKEEKKPVIDSHPKIFTSKEQISKYTELGFALQKCPTETWNIISDSYKLLKENTENFSIETLPSIKNLIQNQLLLTHQTWVGNQPLESSSIQGIESYKKGEIIKPSFESFENCHVSSVIIVDKDLKCGCQNKKYGDDWPFDIQGHDGEWYKIYAEPGDIILYESAICEHGRKEPFQGNFYRNLYVHYKYI
jgi:prolyl 4-hydroxylase